MAQTIRSNEPKKGLGCCGCGCLILLLLVLLTGGLVAYSAHVIYQFTLGVTDPQADVLPVLDGGDEIYRTAEQKVSDFQRGVQMHRASQLELSAMEMDTLIARNKGFRGHLEVEITNGVARVRTTASLAGIPFFVKYGIYQGRFLNTDQSFTLGFDAESHQVHVGLQDLRWGHSTPLSAHDLEKIQPYIDPTLNARIQGQPELKSFIDQVTSLKLQDDHLLIETREGNP